MKNTLHFILFFGLVILSDQLFGQKRTVLISGKITDEYSGKPIKGVNIQLVGTFYGTITNQSGEYELKIKNRSKFNLKFSHISYHTQLKDFSFEEDSINSKIENLVLQTSTQQLPTATIKVNYEPITVYSSFKHSVADFVFLKNGFLFLAYDKFQRYTTKLLLVDKDNQIKVEYFTPVPLTELFTDFEGTYYGVGKHDVYKIRLYHNKIQLTKVDRSEFEENIKKLEDTISNGNILFSNYQWFYPRFSYFELNRWNNKTFQVAEVVNKELEHLMRMQYYFMSPSDKTYARKLGAKYGTEKQIVGAFMVGFQNSIYYEKLYAPLLVVNDTVNVFDHYSNYIYKYKSAVGIIDSVKIDYHLTEKNRNWEREIILDEATNQIYAVFEKEGYKTLKRINRFTGEVEGEFKLYYKWIDRIRVQNNEVYYVYRPYESLQKKYLYKEMLAIN